MSQVQDLNTEDLPGHLLNYCSSVCFSCMWLQDSSDRSQVGITASCILKTGPGYLILANFNVTSISGALKDLTPEFIIISHLPDSFSPPVDYTSLLISQVVGFTLS